MYIMRLSQSDVSSVHEKYPKMPPPYIGSRMWIHTTSDAYGTHKAAIIVADRCN